MTTVEMKTTINASAAALWQTVSDFKELGKYVEAVAATTIEGAGVGARRNLTLQDGSILVEQLESLDNGAMTLEYSIVSGPLPVDNYLSKMEVREIDPSSSELCWSSAFTPKGVSEAEAREVMESIYVMGFEGLNRLFA
ncbi:SRPBCC family protein [Desulfogranum mediterraneum]|uniref:SRPBCC family protein n=1 Tax=Desulfogranum mediterraneum TaxID=160661 RepID=UPI000409887B|nr:SRPBCC family protein [Desulfogranum mediterraneum]